MLIEENKNIWANWWGKKIKANLELVKQAKRGNYEIVARLIDTNYSKDLAASVNY